MSTRKMQIDLGKLDRFRYFVGAVLTLITLLAAIHFLLPENESYFAEISFRAPENLQINYLQKDITSEVQCEKVIKAFSENVQRACSDCIIDIGRCLENLSARQKLKISGEKIDVPAMRLPKGIMTFETTQSELAIQTCNETARQTGPHAQCIPPVSQELTSVLATAGNLPAVFAPSAGNIGLLTLLAFATSFLVCGLIIRSQGWHGRYTHDAVDSGPQKLHTVPVPRIGGIAVAIAIATVLLGLAGANLLSTPAVHGFSLLALSAIPAFAGGFAEDLTKKVGVLARLLLTMTAGALASVLIGATLDRLDVPGLDKLLEYWPLFAVAFTAFAVGGVANAVNIIDGHNGLAGGFAIASLSAFIWVSLQTGDHVVLIASLTMLGAIAGFFVWNWPSGKIFLGDGGAYLLGFWMAELGILLVVRNPEVSPWFPLLAMAFPIWETLFSIYRRCIWQTQRIGEPDAMHFHQLIYRSLKRKYFSGQENGAAPLVNHKVLNSMLPWLIAPPIAAAGFSTSTMVLIPCAAAFCLAYILAYKQLDSGT